MVWQRLLTFPTRREAPDVANAYARFLGPSGAVTSADQDANLRGFRVFLKNYKGLGRPLGTGRCG